MQQLMSETTTAKKISDFYVKLMGYWIGIYIFMYGMQEKYLFQKMEFFNISID